MKAIKTIMALALLSVLVSFTHPVPKQIASHVAKVESECSDWTEKDWDKSNTKFNRLIEDFEEHYSNFTSDEKDMAFKAIGKYRALQVKYKVDQAEGAIKEFGARIPSLVEGFLSAFE